VLEDKGSLMARAKQMMVTRAMAYTILVLIAAIAPQARAQFIDHQGGCRQWEQIGQRIYADYHTKYKTILSLGRSQASDLEADARARGWNEDYINHLLMIASDVASGQFNNMEQLGTHVFNRCIAAWQAMSTPEQRTAEAREADKRRAEKIMAEEKRLADGRRAMTCSEYQGMAWQLIGMQRSGMTYQQAGNWAASKAYGPGGQAHRFSEDNANSFMALAAAVYFARDKYGESDQAFATRAFEGCMRGELLDASQPN
jgi:hypothetical protein